MLCTKMFHMMLSYHIGAPWVEGELTRLLPKTLQFKGVAEETFAAHCSPSFFMLKFYLLDHLVEDLRRFCSYTFTDLGPFGDFIVLVKKSFRMMFRRFATRLYKTVKNMISALGSVQRPRSEVHGDADGSSVV